MYGSGYSPLRDKQLLGKNNSFQQNKKLSGNSHKAQLQYKTNVGQFNPVFDNLPKR
jgi:hypothetical protein